ncbi:OsmC family protein [Aromatoleum evansii]|uniref:OsmC family protein n=1 Tax=Aromatoleum evansii TaxID=59406 RepID=A0ABZ1AGQ6_AROEV|nr:OsmC family protein [Aromatoleum evansii]NMG31513.1 OsmC family peroxiredoxin [Aromatoleum evansii]WRL45063.1 OsmC family protein [Aromatoleum evansii]
MSMHTATIEWSRAPHEADPKTFTRNHVATMAGGQQVKMSSSPDFLGDPHCADPEQMVISALASCHMLFFLALADVKGFPVAHYSDNPVGELGKTDKGMALTRIVLSPRVGFVDKQPDADTLAAIHASAHKRCFIANSLTAKVELDLG